MTPITLRFVPALLAGSLTLLGTTAAPAQSTNGVAPSSASGDGTAHPQISPDTQPSSQRVADTAARRRAARRRARTARPQTGQQTQPVPATVAPTAAQRQRDAQILAAQKAQSSASARENDALTQKVVADQQKQQAEPRIQDAPGPDSQPLAGNPAVAPAPSGEPPRIQDAPGPAQTLPQAPPATPAPQP